MDDNSEKTPSKASKSPQKSSKRPKTVPVKVTLLDGSDYETAVEVCYSIFITEKKMIHQGRKTKQVKLKRSLNGKNLSLLSFGWCIEAKQ